MRARPLGIVLLLVLLGASFVPAAERAQLPQQLVLGLVEGTHLRGAPRARLHVLRDAGPRSPRQVPQGGGEVAPLPFPQGLVARDGPLQGRQGEVGYRYNPGMPDETPLPACH